jgi:L-ornithine N5-oxygenase
MVERNMGRGPRYDILGVGFGPANLAVAVALEELWPDASVRFVEAHDASRWQPGMMLPRSDIQHHPMRDLVTPRNPRSRYSFVNYLHECGRLFQFLNVPMTFPLRKEYARYIGWVAEHFADRVDYGRRVLGIEVLPDVSGYRVRTDDDTVYESGALVLAPGRTPYVPSVFADAIGPRVFHATDYLFRMDALARDGIRDVVVVGGSQSSCELVLDLARRLPHARVRNILRSFGYRLKDTSPFMEEVYFPEFVDYYYGASRESKDALDHQLRYTNYSSADEDVIKELYLEIYEQRLDGEQRVFVESSRNVETVDVDEDEVRLVVREVHTGEEELVRADAVVLATGFRDLGTGPRHEPYPPLLTSVAHLYRSTDQGRLWVGPDYELAATGDGEVPPMYLNGLCESTHGMGDAGSFSLLALRSARIVTSLQRRALVPDVVGS